MLRFDREAYSSRVEAGDEIGDEGVEEAFDVIAEISEVSVALFYSFERTTQPLISSVKTAKWVGDCFVYTNSANRLNYLIGSQTHTVTHFDTYVSDRRSASLSKLNFVQAVVSPGLHPCT